MEPIGFIKMFRSFRSWEWWEDVNVSRLFLNLLLEVNYVDDNWKGHLIKRGQTITSLDKLVKQTGLSKHVVRLCLNKLKSTHEIACKTTHNFTLVEVLKYNDFQSLENTNGTLNGTLNGTRTAQERHQYKK